jgi:5-formyltetrahydrofolate cyclo-ligase
MTKSALRNSYRQKRLALKAREINTCQDLMLINFQQMPMPFIQILHTYLPISQNNEPDPQPLADWLSFTNPGMQLAHPVSNPTDSSMRHFICNEQTLYKIGNYGVPEPLDGIEIEPKEIDMVLIPLLAFDLSGNRVGYGKGFYDRFLSECRPEVIKIGLSFFSPVDSIEDADFFDKKLDFCITPDCVYAF